MFRRRIPTLDELCTGKIGNVKAVLENNRRMRNEYSQTTHGYSRQRNMRHVMDIPMEIYFHPEGNKYFAGGMDKHERRKNRTRFLQKFPIFGVVDKL